MEIFFNDQWGAICDNGWDVNDAKVICKQLGFPGPSRSYSGSYFGPATGPIWLDDVSCSGSETHIYDCRHRGWGSHDCTHGGNSGVLCSYASSNIRLADGGPSYGRVKVYHNGQWGTVCDDHWDINDTNVVCRQLRFSDSVLVTFNQMCCAKYGEGSNPIWLDDVKCSGGEASLFDCYHLP